MKLLLSIILTLSASVLAAQKNEYFDALDQQYQIGVAEFTTPHGTVQNTVEASVFLKNELLFTIGYDLKLISVLESQFQKHYTFVETFEGIEIYQAIIKLNTDKKGKITSVFSSYQKIENVANSAWPKESAAVINLPEKSNVLFKNPIWVKKDDTFHRAFLVNYMDEKGYDFERMIDNSNSVLYTFERTSHFTDADTTAKGYVFKPDPITSANTVYGGSFINNNDATNPDFDDERFEVDITVNYDSTDQTFYLENDYVKIDELSPPVTTPTTSTSPAFYYDRSESGFEDVNVMYHMTQQQLYLQELGFTNLVNYQIAVDAHGLNGDDNSAFNSFTNPPSIYFGEGGVDDAEDADVIIHEYSHAIMHSAAPNTNFGDERRAMDEAFGDYLATSYSRLSEYYQDSWVYNWDGHNEYWNGRVVTSSKIWPADLDANFYKNAPMWSSALLRIERNIGRDSTNVILLNAIFNFTGNMTMGQAAQLILQQDSLIFNEKYYAEICYTFLDKGMVSSCKVSRPSGLVGLEELNRNNLHVLNTAKFANGTGNIELVADEDFEVLAYDISGHIIKTYTSKNRNLQIATSDFNSGVYILKISFEDQVKSVTITKY